MEFSNFLDFDQRIPVSAEEEANISSLEVILLFILQYSGLFEQKSILQGTDEVKVRSSY